MLQRQEQKLAQEREDYARQDAGTQQLLKDLQNAHRQTSQLQLGRDKVDIAIAQEGHKRKMDMQKAYWTEVTNRAKSKDAMQKAWLQQQQINKRHGENIKQRGLDRAARRNDARKSRNLRRQLGMLKVGAIEGQTHQQQVGTIQTQKNGVLSIIAKEKTNLNKEIVKSKWAGKIAGPETMAKESQLEALRDLENQIMSVDVSKIKDAGAILQDLGRQIPELFSPEVAESGVLISSQPGSVEAEALTQMYGKTGSYDYTAEVGFEDEEGMRSIAPEEDDY
tara:strand:+ start:1842 stop:2678 length:837 start_codon:yes stop_codon:yes gene_type:complete